MSAITVELPNELQIRLERMSKESGVSVAELLVDAADKMSQMDILEKIKRDGANRDTDNAFKRFLASVPDVDPIHPDDIIK